MTIKSEMIEAAKRRIGWDPAFTPEHTGLSDDGRVMSIQETMPGGGMVVDKKSLEAQSEPAVEPIPVFALDRDIQQIQRDAAAELAQEQQKEAEKSAKADEREQRKHDREEAAEQKAAKPVRIVEDKTDDKPAI